MVPALNVGIDLSLNSTSMCYRLPGGATQFKVYNSVSTYTSSKRMLMMDPLKLIEDSELLSTMLESCAGEVDLEINRYKYGSVSKSNPLNTWHSNCLECNHLLSKSMSEFILGVAGDNPINVCLENYSYGSRGDATIQIIELTSALKVSLYRAAINRANFYLVTGPTLKMYAGKGDYDKYQMLQAYLERGEGSKFYDFLASNGPLITSIGTKKGKPVTRVNKPVDDMVDSYFVLKYMEEHFL